MIVIEDIKCEKERGNKIIMVSNWSARYKLQPDMVSFHCHVSDSQKITVLAISLSHCCQSHFRMLLPIWDDEMPTTFSLQPIWDPWTFRAGHSECINLTSTPFRRSPRTFSVSGPAAIPQRRPPRSPATATTPAGRPTWASWRGSFASSQRPPGGRYQIWLAFTIERANFSLSVKRRFST